MSELSNVLKSGLQQALAWTPSFNQVSFVASFGIVFGVQRLVKTEGGDWYKKSIAKPSWTPPNWIFPLVRKNNPDMVQHNRHVDNDSQVIEPYLLHTTPKLN